MHTIKNRHGVLLVLMFAWLLIGCKPQVSRLFQEGSRLLEEGNYAGAVAKFKVAASSLGTNAVAWNALGLAHHYAGDLNSAELAYDRALACDRDLTEARYNLGCVLLEQNKAEAARAQFTTFVLRNGPSAGPLLKLGAAQLALRDTTGAEKSFQEVLRLSPQNAEALNGLGLAKMQRSRWNEAALLFSQARRAQPSSSSATLNLAILKHQYHHDLSGALPLYREYASLAPPPQKVDAVKSLIRSLESELLASSTGASSPSTLAANPMTNSTSTKPVTPAEKPVDRSSNAVARLQAPPAAKPESSVRAANPLPPPVGTSRFEVVKVADDPVIKAAQDFSPPIVTNAARKEGPPPVETKTVAASPQPAKRNFLQSINPANLFHRSDKSREAAVTPLATPPAAVSSAPQPVSTPPPAGTPRYTYHGRSKPVPGNRPEAERAFGRGLVAQKARQNPQAIEAYREATRLDMAFFEAHYNLALAYAKQGDNGAALLSYETALAIRPDSADARYNFGLLLMESRYTIDAANEFNKVLEENPREGRAHLALANLYAQQLRQPDQARLHYQRVLEINPTHPQADAISRWLAANP